MKSLKDMQKVVAEFHVQPRPEMQSKVLEDAFEMQRNQEPQSIPGIFRWRTLMKSRIPKYAAAVVMVMVILLGINLFNGSMGRTSMVWAEEIRSALATIQGVSCCERTIFVNADGSQHPSSTWDVLYYSPDSYRRDIYDGETLREIQWYVPDGDGMLQYSIRYDLGSYFVERHSGSFGTQNPMDQVRFYLQYLDRTAKLLGTKPIDGADCMGFAIPASTYGDNPEPWIDEIWFDVESKLPVVIEQQGRPVTDHPEITFTTIQNEFRYNDELPGDTFTPSIPGGYILGHPDEIQKN